MISVGSVPLKLTELMRRKTTNTKKVSIDLKGSMNGTKESLLSALEWMVEECEGEDEPNFMEIVSNNYGFLTEEEVEECASDLETEMVAATGKEF